MTIGSHTAQWVENAWTRGTPALARLRMRDPIDMKLGGFVEDTHRNMLSKFEHSGMNRTGYIHVRNHVIENSTFS